MDAIKKNIMIANKEHWSTIKETDKERELKLKIAADKKLENIRKFDKFVSIQEDKRKRAQQNKSMVEKEIHDSIGYNYERL